MIKSAPAFWRTQRGDEARSKQCQYDRISERIAGYSELTTRCLTVGARSAHVMLLARNKVANRFGTDILIQAPDPMKAAQFYVEHLGFEITDDNPNMIALHGKHLNLFIELGSPLGPVLRSDGWQRCRGEAAPGNGCEIVKDEPDFPRCYVKDPFGLIYNLTS